MPDLRQTRKHLAIALVAMAGLPMAEPARAEDAASATAIFRQLNDTSIAIYQEAAAKVPQAV